MITPDVLQSGEVSSDLFQQARQYVEAYVRTANGWEQGRIEQEAIYLARYAGFYGMCSITQSRPTRQGFQTHLPKGEDGLRQLINRQRPPTTLLANAVSNLASNLAVVSNEVVVCNVGAGTTDLPFEKQFKDVLLIDPAYTQLQMHRHPNSVRGYKYVAQPFSMDHLPDDSPTIVTFEFSLHHIAVTSVEIAEWMQAICSASQVMGVVIMDYNLHDHQPEFLLTEFQTVFATMAERREIQVDGIAASLLGHSLPLFPVASEALQTAGFVQLENTLFPHFDPEFGDITEGLSSEELQQLSSTKCSQLYLRSS